MENIVGQPPQPARRQQGQLIWKEASSSGKRPAHLERGQVIWKIQKERLTINIVGWRFSQLVRSRPSSSTCGKAPAHREKSKRVD